MFVVKRKKKSKENPIKFEDSEGIKFHLENNNLED
jgi:hypothetical protein